MEGGKNSDPMVEERSRRRKEVKSKLGEREKEKLRPKPSKKAVETVLSQEGVPKWMEKLRAVIMRPFEDPEALEGNKRVHFLSNRV